MFEEGLNNPNRSFNLNNIIYTHLEIQNKDFILMFIHIFTITGQHGLFGKTRRPRTAFTVESWNYLNCVIKMS